MCGVDPKRSDEKRHAIVHKNRNHQKMMLNTLMFYLLPWLRTNSVGFLETWSFEIVAPCPLNDRCLLLNGVDGFTLRGFPLTDKARLENMFPSGLGGGTGGVLSTSCSLSRL